MIKTTIPEKALVAFPDMSIVAPEEAKISAYDRSFHFGDSLYEAVRTYNGILFALDEHMARLKRSAEMAMYEVMPDLDHIVAMTQAGCSAFFQKFGNTDAFVRITVSRGIGDINIDRATASAPYPLAFIKEAPSYPEKYFREGLHYWVVDRRRNHPQALHPAMKTGNYLNNVLALAEAKKHGAYDALMLDYQGYVTEGTTNNVFAVKNGEVWTAPVSVGILAGVTKDWVLKLCKQEGIPVQERLFTLKDIDGCQEMFASATTKEIVPITKLSGHSVGQGKPGPVTQRIATSFKKMIARYCEEHRSESLFT